MLFGLVAIILIPNLGNASFRIPLTRFHVPVFIEVAVSRVQVTLDYLTKFPW